MKNDTASDERRWRWGNALVAILGKLKGSATFAPGYRDFEVIPPLDGSPGGIAVWFICDTRSARDQFRECSLSSARVEVIHEMEKSGFSAEAASSLWCDVTSQEDIEIGGGRFAFFR
jgi:hypothetical protein